MTSLLSIIIIAIAAIIVLYSLFKIITKTASLLWYILLILCAGAIGAIVWFVGNPF